MNFDKLNEILSVFMEEDEFVEEEYSLIKNFCSIIINSGVPLYKTKYKSRMGLNTSLQYSLNFLQTLSPGYRDNLEKLIVNDQLYIYDDKDDNYLSQLVVEDGKSVIMLYSRSTIEDSYTLTHENIHDTNRDLKKLTVSWHLMTETFSILSEMLQREYFRKLDIVPKDFRLNEMDTLVALYIKACRLDFELELIFAYNKYGVINQFVYNEILSKYTNIYEKSEAENHLLDIIDNQDLYFDSLQRYVIGGVMSSYMFERISDKPSRVREFVELNDYINDISFIDVIKYLDLDVVDEQYAIMSNDSNKILRQSYIKRMKQVYK